MRKFLAAAAIASLIGGSSFAVTNVVSSANIVGYNQITIPSNQLVLISTSFINDSNTVDGLFGTLPIGSTISFWNSTAQIYSSVSKTRSGWGVLATNIVKRGEGVFVSLPINTQTNLYFSGDVPLDTNSQVYTVNGLALMSYPYPADVSFTNTSLAKSAAIGDTISFWNNGWNSFSKTRSGWVGATNVILQLGQAFFYQASTNSTLNESCPYTIN